MTSAPFLTAYVMPRATVVVAARRDDARDVRSVAVRVVRDVVGGDEVPALEDTSRQVGVPRADSRVEDRDDDALAGRLLPHRLGLEPVERPLLVAVGVVGTAGLLRRDRHRVGDVDARAGLVERGRDQVERLAARVRHLGREQRPVRRLLRGDDGQRLPRVGGGQDAGRLLRRWIRSSRRG
jgi:hypothetical protein